MSTERGVPVYVEDRLRYFVDPVRARRVALAENVAAVVRGRKGAIVRITLRAVYEDPAVERGGGGCDPKLTYREQLGGHAVVILKRHDPETGRYVHWSDDEGFDPRRFNPDRLPKLRR